MLCSRSTHGTVQYFLRSDSHQSSSHALLTLHSREGLIFSNAFQCKHSHWRSHSGLAPVTLRSRSNQKIFRPERDWIESGALTNSPVTVLQGLSECVLLVCSACYVVYIMEMKKAQEKLKLELTMNGAKNMNAQGFDRTMSGE